MKQTAVEWLVQRLEERGITWMATLCGHGLDPLYDAAHRAGFKLIDTRNEQTAGYIAECYGRLTRQPGICAVSSGIAHVNALSGVVNAHFDGAPMLLISGAGANRTRGLGHFQELPQVEMAAPVTCYSRAVDLASRVVQLLDEALDTAVFTPGPAHLTIPLDIQTEQVSDSELIAASRARRKVLQDDPAAAAAALAAAQRPLIVAGSGLFYAGTGDEMLTFAEKYSIPVVVPIWDRGPVDRKSEVFMGVLGAATGGPRLLPDADCILLAGAVNDYRTGFLPPGNVVHLEGAWTALAAAYERAGGKPVREWLAEAHLRNSAFHSGVEERAKKQAEQGMHAIHIIGALRAVLTQETVVLIDGGSIGQWAHQALCDRYPGHWLTCGRSGAVGWGLAGAMAARIAYPQRPVILLAGDGAFTFNVADIECAARQSLPFVAIVADDQAWGITRIGHIEKYGEAISSSLGPIAIDRLAESLGAYGVRVKSPAEIEPAIRSGLSRHGVTVIQVPIIGGNPGA